MFLGLTGPVTYTSDMAIDALTISGEKPRKHISSGSDGTCGFDIPEANKFIDILWAHGVLYMLGGTLSGVLASSHESDDFLQWNGNENQFFSTRGSTNNLCGAALAVSGHFLYVLGFMETDLTLCDYRNSSGINDNDGNTLWVFDITNPIAPEEVSITSLDTRTADMALSGNYIYFSSETSDGIVIVNISDRSNPILVGAFASPGENSQIETYGGAVYINGVSTGINVIDGR